VNESEVLVPTSGTGAGGRPHIVLRNVTKHYDRLQALDDVSLKIEAGNVVAVVGPSGSGKSTLCRCINGLERIDSGSIEVSGTPLPDEGMELAQLRTRVGMVFQSFNLFPHMTVLENLTLAPVGVLGISKTEARQRAESLLERVGIQEKAKSYPADLSGGQQQRVAIARALAMEPEALLFDEPTSALDVEAIKEVLDVMADLAHAGMTMVVVTHEMGFANSAADRVVFMEGGRIVEESSPRNFFSHPETDRGRKFMETVLAHRL
jgi:glutamate transport system ATP-binding protein